MMGTVTGNQLGNLVKLGLDAARGALLALSPELAKGKVGLESLDSAGRMVYNTITGIATTVKALIEVLKPAVAVLGSMFSLISKMGPVLEALGAFAVSKTLVSVLGNITGLSLISSGGYKPVAPGVSGNVVPTAANADTALALASIGALSASPINSASINMMKLNQATLAFKSNWSGLAGGTLIRGVS